MQSPHDFFNHDLVQHYVVGRHEQSLFYRVVCPGKDRHGAAYWCGLAALLRRGAPPHCFAGGGHIGGHLVDASAAGVGLVLDAPATIGERPAVLLALEDADGGAHEVAAQVEIRSCREADERWLVGGRRPAAPVPGVRGDDRAAAGGGSRACPTARESSEAA